MADDHALPQAPRVHVVMCVDAGFVVPLAAALASLAESRRGSDVTVHVVHPGLEDADRTKVEQSATDLDVVWHRMDVTAIRGAHVTSFLSAATLYRLVIGDILPADLHRVIYLDADVLVADDLAELNATDIAPHAIGAVRDAGSPWAAGMGGTDWRALGIAPSAEYFNAGVLLIDLDAWRAEQAGDKAIDILRRIEARWGDQDALNLVFEGRWTSLHPRWNVQTPDFLGEGFGWALWRDHAEQATERPGVIHYTTRAKPWVPGTDHPEAERWFDALDRTPWAGWRPRVGSDPIGRVLRGGLRRIRAMRNRRRSRLPR